MASEVSTRPQGIRQEDDQQDRRFKDPGPCPIDEEIQVVQIHGKRCQQALDRGYRHAASFRNSVESCFQGGSCANVTDTAAATIARLFRLACCETEPLPENPNG